MFGSFGGDFYAGFRDRGEALLGQRQKAVEAFNEFKRQNPTATYAEFQQYVDSITGGDNYLRGQLPGDQILRQLGADGERRRADEADQRAFERVKRTAERDAIYEQIARGAWENGLDPNSAAEEYAKANGIEDPAQRLALVQQLNTVHGRKRQSWETEATNAYWDRINQQIQSGMLTDENAIGADAPKHLANLPVFQERAGAAKTALQRMNTRYQQESFERAERMAESLAQNVEVLTAQEAGTKVVAAMREQGYLRDNDKASENLIRSIAHRATARYQEARAARQAEKNRGLQQYLLSPTAMEAIRVGGRPAFEEQVATYAATMGEPISAYSEILNSPQAFSGITGLINVGGRATLTSRMLQTAQNMQAQVMAEQKRNAAVIDATLGEASKNSAFASAVRGLATEYTVDPGMLEVANAAFARGELGQDPGTIRNRLLQIPGFARNPTAQLGAMQDAASSVDFETLGAFSQGNYEEARRTVTQANSQIDGALAVANKGDPESALATLAQMREELAKKRAIVSAGVKLRTIDYSWLEASGEAATPDAVARAAAPLTQTLDNIERRIQQAEAVVGRAPVAGPRSAAGPQTRVPTGNDLAATSLTDDELAMSYRRELTQGGSVARLKALKEALLARARNDLLTREHNRIQSARDAEAERRRKADLRQAELDFR